MVTLTDNGCFVVNGNHLIEEDALLEEGQIDAQCGELDLPPVTKEMLNKETARRGTIAYRILSRHSHSDDIDNLVSSVKPGDGSAREQAASCRKVLGVWANVAREYATKRYRSNCINWGILPLISESELSDLSLDSYIFLPGIKNLVENGSETVGGWLINGETVCPLTLSLPDLTEKDRAVLLAGNLINYHAGSHQSVAEPMIGRKKHKI